MTGPGDNTITLNLASVTQADVLGAVHKLFITGDSGDGVSFMNSTVLNQTRTEQTVNSVPYNVYHLDNTHDLLIQQAIANVTFS